MSAWTAAELDAIGPAEELEITSPRADGTLRPYVVIWVVRVADELYVRSAYGPEAAWYRHAMEAGHGRILSAGFERDVRFVDAPAEINPALDDVYHAKYDRHGAAYVNPVVGEHRYDVTIRLVPVEA